VRSQIYNTANFTKNHQLFKMQQHCEFFSSLAISKSFEQFPQIQAIKFMPALTYCSKALGAIVKSMPLQIESGRKF
jgi:hypothetical protein